MKVCWMLKRQKNNKIRLTFWFNFFNLLPHWLGGKLESLSSLFRVYRICLESTKKEFTQESTRRWQVNS